MNKDKHILIVEDEQELILLMKYRLEYNGYKISIAADGEEALNMIYAGEFDLIILDIMLPRVDGYKVCSELKSNPNYRNIPILIFTAKGGVDSQKTAFELGADAYMVKPYEPDTLLYKIRSLLKKEGSHLDN